jgi:hypothetical protein
VRKLPFILAPLLILAGAWVVLFCWGIADSVVKGEPPGLTGWAYWRAVSGVLLEHWDDGPLLGVGLIVAGLLVAAGGGRRPRAAA